MKTVITVILCLFIYSFNSYGGNPPEPGGGRSSSSAIHAAAQNVGSRSSAIHAAAKSGVEAGNEVNSSDTSAVAARLQVRVTVTDADEHIPMELVRVAISKNGTYITDGVTNTAGQVRFRDIRQGTYTITSWFIGYQTFVDSIGIDREHVVYTIAMRPTGIKENEVEVVGQREPSVSHINPMTANQVFESETYHAPPTARMTNLIQQNVMGAVRAPTGEVHIRGQHGEFTYYVDGIPVPLGVFGGLNEVVDPKAIDRATFITGGFPAEYGGQMSAVIDLNNRVPTGSFYLDASTYGGSYLVLNGTKPFSPGGQGTSAGDTLGGRVGPFRALNSNGQALSFSDHIGKLGFFFSGARQETDRRVDPPTPVLFHDHGFDYFLYSKLDYILSDIDYLTTNFNVGKTHTEIPYDPLGQIASDLQETSNAFQTLSYFRTIDAEIDHESNLFLGAYAREGGLTHTPGIIDPPAFQFIGDTTQSYRLAEDRRFTTVGMRSTFEKRLSHEFVYKIGMNASTTNGKENFTSTDTAGAPGPSTTTDFTGADAGIFAQADVHPAEWTTIELGARFDQHIAPEVPLQHQVSPRVRWNVYFDENNTAYVYYGRLFMPTNIEGLRSIAVNVSRSLEPTLPERDDFYEAVYTHVFPFGLRSKAAVFYKNATPGLDDQTVGSSAIKTPVNIERVRTTGIEFGLSFSSPETPFSGYLNSSLIHAYGTGRVSGGFLQFDNEGASTDLDHDQRLSVVAEVNYQTPEWYVSVAANYGSGLTNGNPDHAAFGTGLFDFNTAAHTAPSWIVNLGAGRTVHLAGGATLEPSVYVTNFFDHDHLMKGVYFSGASWEERRNVVVKVAVHI
jgi:hypothetical protein